MEWSWKKYFPCVLPLPVVMNPNAAALPRWDHEESILVDDASPAVGYHVPFKDALAQFLSIEAVFEAVIKNFEDNRASIPTEDCDVRYSDVWDSKFVRQHPLFIALEGAILGIQIYYDDVEPANPLGSNKGQHKQGVFYWSLMNLPPHLRSNLRSIQIIAVVNSSYLREHGPDLILKSFMDSISELQTGIEIKVKGETKLFHGILINSVGDMPASCYLAGTKEGVGLAYSPCRICSIKRHELDIFHHESQCPMRERDSHTQQVAAIMDQSISSQTRTALSREYGIVRGCCLLTIPDFDPTKQFPHDLMHVLYEGILNLELRLLLAKLFEEAVIDIDIINRKLASLKSCREFTTPPKISKKQVLDHTPLSFSSSEMQCLITILPLVLGEYCSSENHPHFSNFILLIRIAASLQCYSFSERDLDELSFLIRCHNSSFVLLYPSSNGPSITPKLHALLHLPNQIRLFGPPRYSWAFRYESKNAPIKRVMRNICNFSNISFSIIQSFQRLGGLYKECCGENKFFGIKDDLKIVCLASKAECLKNRPWFPALDVNDDLSERINVSANLSVQTIEKCKISGRLCRKGAVFVKCLPTADEILPVFWRIADIFCFEHKNVIVFETMSTSFFDEDKFSFIVVPTQKYSATVYNSLCYNVPLHSFVRNDKGLYVVPNYYHLR